eukprot:TRINITY_DN6367_c0_g1_i1.p1 TRINITY_DN6367_c0_g1~~TRINITY_DN6367_c0_g1_i1.p1  ORF type:complete len:390 (+),score=88.64 TRINITY_DN6367_c0_g1_i1:158-1327(+)
MELSCSVYGNVLPKNVSALKCIIQRGFVKRTSCRKGRQVRIAKALEVGIQAGQMQLERSIRWGSVGVQGRREEMEDALVLRIGALNGYTYAAVFDGHAGFSSAEFLRDNLYQECAIALEDGSLLESKDWDNVMNALKKAFWEADKKLLTWLETTNVEADSGSTATVMFVGGENLLISHLGDSSVVLSSAGKVVELTKAHRPYGNSTVSRAEIKRIKEAGGWVSNGRICGDISVSRAFGDMRFKTKKKEMLEEGIREGKWTQKFVSRIRNNGDWVIATPDVHHTILKSEVEFIILASDGLWDCMKSSDAVNFVRSQLRKHGDVQFACEALAKAALNRNAQDNVSIIIADMGKILQHDGPEEEMHLAIELLQAAATVGIVCIVMWLSSFIG